MEKYKSRKDVPLKYKWDLTEFFKNEKEYDESFNKCKKEIKKLNTYKGKIHDANVLYEFLDLDIKTLALLFRIDIYSYIKNDEELGISKNVDRKNKAEKLFSEYKLAVSFFEEEFLKLDKEQYNNLFKENNKLNEFKYALDEIYKNKDHILSEEKEKIIETLSNAMNHFEDMSSTMLNSLNNYGTININGEEEKVLTTNYRRLLKNEDKEIRKKVRNQLNEVLMQYSPLSASLLNSYVNANIEIAKLHNFKDAWDRKLFSRNMDNKAYNALIESVEKNIPVFQKYLDIYKRVLGLKELTFADLNLDIANNKKEYSIEDAQNICLNTLSILGSDYKSKVEKVFKERNIDYACYPKKCSGGYNISGLDVNSRILMSFNYDLDSVSTIIHEVGHHVNHQYVKANNPLQYRETSNIVAEVASLTNECLLSYYLVNNSKDKNERLAGLANIINVVTSNLFGAVREGKIELDFYNHVNDGNTITSDYMYKITTDSIKKYYGDKIKYDDYIGLSWIRRSHYYMDYYLFSYAFCICAALNISGEIINGNDRIKDNYLKFLCLGGDIKPQEAFKTIGFDLNKKDMYNNAIKYFDKMLNMFMDIYEGSDIDG